jgi:ectoine hydroxylase
LDGSAAILHRSDPVLYGSDAGDSGILTPENLASYERDGFLFLKSFYAPDEVEALQEELDRLCHAESVRQTELGVTEPTSGAVRSIFAVHTVSDLFDRLARDERLLGAMQGILGSEVYLHQSRLNLKPGLRGKEFYWHSDFETWHAEDGMPSMRAISCSISLADNREFNGPLMLVPGSHKYFCQCTGRTPDDHYLRSLKRQDIGVPSDEQLRWLVDQSEIAVPTGPPGSVLLFDCNIMHGSNGNITPFPRSNAFFVYNSVENELQAPFSAQHERPAYLANREPSALRPERFHAALRQPA